MGTLARGEPRLKYAPLSQDAVFPGSARRLVVSDKVLALGTSTGAVLVLDYNGNHVKTFKEHITPITDLAFDKSADYLVSSSADGDIVVYGLYTGEIRKHPVRVPVTTVSLDPRYAERKSRDFIYGTDSGDLTLVTKGWLGNSEHPLFKGRGPVHVVRQSGSLLAWVTDTGLRVYDTDSNRRLIKVSSPPGFSMASCGPASLFWLDGQELFVGWKSSILVLRLSKESPSLTARSNLPTAADSNKTGSLSMAPVVELEVPFRVRGVAPFGVTLAVLGTEISTENFAQEALHEDESAQEATVETEKIQDAPRVFQGSAATAEHPIQMQLLPQRSTSPGDSEAQERLDAADVAPEKESVISNLSSATAAPSNGEREGNPGAAPAPGADATEEVAKGSESDATAPTRALSEALEEADDAEQAPANAQPPAEALGPSAPLVAENDATATGSDGDDTSPRPDESATDPPLCFHIIERDGTILSSDRLEVGPDASLAVFYTASALAASGCSPPMSPTVLPDSAASPSAASPNRDDEEMAPGTRPHQAPAASGSGDVAAAAPQIAPEHQSPCSPAADNGSPEASRQMFADWLLPDRRRPSRRFAQPYKWWRDGDEPLYFLTWSKGIIVGRPRDGNDRVTWLLEHKDYVNALSVALTDVAVRRDVREAASDAYLSHLVEGGRYEEAAAAASSLLGDRPLAWERLVFRFAWARRLRILAPHVPLCAPQLQRKTYGMVLDALLKSPSDRSLLLDLVLRWPPSLYNSLALLRSLAPTVDGPAGAGEPALLRAAAHLHAYHGQHAAALSLLLRLRDPDAFAYIEAHDLVRAAARHVAELFELDAARATSLCVDHPQVLSPAQVVGALERAGAAGGDHEPGATWRRRLYAYVSELHEREPALATEFAMLQVELCAEFEPARLMDVLVSSSDYPLERTLRVCEQHDLVREQVYVLARMGAANRALDLIVERQRDVPSAIEFVQEQRDDELWDRLLALAMRDAQLAGTLLDHVNGAIDPLPIVRRIAPGMRIEGLSRRLVRLLRDSRANMSLQETCASILHADQEQLGARLYVLLRSALPRVHLRLNGAWQACGAAVADDQKADTAVLGRQQTVGGVWIGSLVAKDEPESALGAAPAASTLAAAGRHAPVSVRLSLTR